MIETERLIISKFTKERIVDYAKNFDSDITRYQYPEPFESLEEANELLGEFMELDNNEEMLFLSILLPSKEFVGSVEIHGLKEEVPEIGVWICKQFHDRGYAYEALNAVLEYVHTKYGIKHFFYEADVRNIASIKLLEKYTYKQGNVECFDTETGKHLELQGFTIQLED